MLSFKKSILLFFFLLSFLENSYPFQSPVDILIFSPHPDDETLCCGGTIAKAISEKKLVKIVFLTNGDAYTLETNLKGPFQNLPSYEYYIALGKERQKEAQAAAEKLGLKKDDLIFLSYPDRGLFFIWDEDYDVNFCSEYTQSFFSPYELTYGRAKQGYNKKNLLLDIKDILKNYKPKRIYTPLPLDDHLDHSAATKFLYLALDELRAEKEEWIDSIEVFYYLVHKPEKTIFFPEPNYKENIRNYKTKKREALQEYATQMKLKEGKNLFADFLKKDVEEFWHMNLTSSEYLQQLKEEWKKIGKIMWENGYNVNLGVVSDVAKNISCLANRLLRQERIYSDDPKIVTQLALSQVKGMNEAGIIPVVKHFPGLGESDERDPHLWLPKIFLSKEEIFKKALLPYKELIGSDLHFWIMLDHALYPFLDEKPASFSYKIVTELLRKELGFKGIIIVDELYSMGAPQYYLSLLGAQPPYIGEIVTQVFAAGVDLGLVYCRPEEAEEVVLQILEAVEKAVRQGRLKEEDIDDSVLRILEEKEEFFGVSLTDLLREMSLREKIAQKLIFDAYTEDEIEIFKRFGLGGVRIRKSQFANKLKQGLRIPVFIVGEQEGGEVREEGLDIYNKSAYFVGREFERILFKEKKQIPCLERRWIPRSYPASQCCVLCLAAHPDDEDAEALLYLKNKFNCQTYILLFTRGEGGENEINSSLYQDLGFLRTEEMEKASSILGAEKVYYLGKPDFGYTTSLKEVWKRWNKKDTLRKLVYFYRMLKPHIIITKHNKSEMSAQHKAVAILSEEAFDLALPWQPLKLFQRTYEEKYDVFIDPQEKILPENKTYQKIALQSLFQHRSQGFGRWLFEQYKDIKENIYYSLVKSRGVSENKDFLSLNELVEIYKEERQPLQKKFLPSGVMGIKIFPNRIGLIEENNNTLFVVLKTLGFDVERLNADVLAEGELSKFDTLILAQYIYDYIYENYSYDFKKISQNLLKFVEEGGNLVVFNQLSSTQEQFLWTPLFLELSFNPITDENTPVKIISPEESLFNVPNKINIQDFNQWIHQRAWSLAYKYSKKFIELTSCRDSTGKVIKSGYLVGYFGKGRYIYTSYDWNRQLRNFHFGALKNLANMVSFNKNSKEFISHISKRFEEPEIKPELIRCLTKEFILELTNCYLDETRKSFQEGCLCTDGIDNDSDGLVDSEDSDCPILEKDVVIDKDTHLTEDKDISPNGLYILSGTLKIKKGVTLTVGNRGVHVQDGAKIELEEGAQIELK